MFTKKVRKGTAYGRLGPVYENKPDWAAILGVAFIVLVIIGAIAN